MHFYNLTTPSISLSAIIHDTHIVQQIPNSIFCREIISPVPAAVRMASGAGGGDIPQIPLGYQPDFPPESFRNPSSGPLRKLTVDLIKTYRKINEVG